MCKLSERFVCKAVDLPPSGADSHRAVRQSCYRDGATRCHRCGGPFVIHPTLGWKVVPKVVVRRTTEVCFMRGDDVVTNHTYHPACFEMEGVRP